MLSVVDQSRYDVLEFWQYLYSLGCFIYTPLTIQLFILFAVYFYSGFFIARDDVKKVGKNFLPAAFQQSELPKRPNCFTLVAYSQ